MKMSPAPVLAFVLTAAVAGSSLAQPAMPSRDPALAQSGTYKVGTAHTRIVFMVTHMGLTEYFGQFNGATGQLSLDAANPAKSAVSITIPTDSVDTSNAVLNGELKDPTWFNAAQFPTITFTSTKVTATGKDTAKITGDLTFHGVTHPVTLDAKFNAAGPHPFSKKYTMGFNASGQLRRSDFGVSKYVPLVGDDVTLTISAEFEKVS